MGRNFNVNITDEQFEKYRKQFEPLFEKCCEENEDFR